MSYNYNSLLGQMTGKKVSNEDAAHAIPIRQSTFSSFQLFFAASVLSLFGAASALAQTTIINPATDGGFNSGSTFAANGWTVANEGISPIKWAIGTAASGTTAVGSTTNGSATVALTAANANIAVNQAVYGDGIPANTFVSAISGTSLTLSQPATASSTGNITLGFGRFSGGISVATTQSTTTAVVKSGSYSVTLAAANPNISVGMLIAPVANFIGANTYVASISGTTLGLSQATINASDSAVAQALSFTATSSAISGNAAFVTNDNGASYSYGGYAATRTVYFYRDITNVPSAEKAMTLSFDVKSDAGATSGGWQVWVAPISQTVAGTDTQVTSSGTYGVSWPGATLISFNSNPQVATTRTTAFIPTSFAGTPFRLIFVWTNGSSAGTLPPAAIDNISLTSRMSAEISTAHSGLWSQPGTWNGGQVPTPADTVVLDDDGESVVIDSRYSGCQDLFLAGSNTLVQHAISSTMDEFAVYNDFTLNASAARFNIHDSANGKLLKVGHDITVAANARLDGSLGKLLLNGSSLQTVNVDPAGFVGGSVAGQNAYGNVAGVLNQLEVTNTATVSPNIIWNANGVRINNQLILTTGRVSVTSPNRLILGNYGDISSMTVPAGYGFVNGTICRWISSSNTKNIQPGTEYPGTDISSKPNWYPFASATGGNRSLYLLPDAAPATAGEVAITYTDASTVTNNLSIADGSYTINKRYNGSWAFSTPEGKADAAAPSVVFAPNATTPTFRIGVYANGAYEAIDGSSRLMNASAALAGTHQEGTTQPFVFRTGLAFANLTALPVFVGANNASVLNTDTAITSAASGDWNTASTWVGGVVPTCNNIVNIAHNVTVTTAATAAGVIIKQGATLTNNSAATTMTVGNCANNSNNAAFYNYGTHTMTTGNLVVNGFVAHKTGSFFNQTGGEIIIDSNNNGDAATSVAFGGSSCKIETSNLALTGGKITIVDPLVNQPQAPINVTTVGTYTVNTAGAAGTYTRAGGAMAVGANLVTFSQSLGLVYVGQTISATGLPANTTITAVAPDSFGFNYNVTLSNAATAAITSGATFTFTSMSNGVAGIVVEGAGNGNIAAGQAVSGSGIQPGTKVVNVTGTATATAGFINVTLSLPVLGLGTSPATSPQPITFEGVNIGTNSIVLPAVNSAIIPGQPVSGNGLKPGTFVTAVTGALISLSEPVQTGAPSPMVLNFSPDTSVSSGAFVYTGPKNYATGLNHTLQIGDGVSTQKGTAVTNGFNCVFQTPVSMISLGNLIVNAPDGDNRFMSTTNFGTNSSWGAMNVQNQLTITAGSTLKKVNGNCNYYVGGNIVNNGSFLQPSGSSILYLGNFSNGVAVATALPQTISGTGTWSNNQYALNPSSPTGSIGALTVNNTSAQGVTLQVPNFRAIGSVTLTNGIVHTSATYPLSLGIADVTSTQNSGSFSGGGGTSYIDGPCAVANPTSSTIAQFKLFPTGKNGKYLPIQIASTGGVELMAEAFDTNSGTVNAANASGLSAVRWKVSRVGTAGTFTGYNVRLGSTPNVTAANVIVQSATENGVYDIVSTPTSATSYDLAYFATPNIPTIYLATAQTGGFLGNFAYASGPGCTGTPAPGATIASSTSACGGQSVTLSLTTPTTGAGVTYQWQSSTNNGTTWTDIAGATAATYAVAPIGDTSYRANVTCSGSTGASTLVKVTTTPSAATVTGSSMCTAGTANLTAAGSQILDWYDAQTGGNLVATGTSYSPTVSQTTTYYVASGSVSTGTPVNAAAYTGTSTNSTLFSGIAFDAVNSLNLKTVTVYPKNTASLTPITIGLFNAAGNVVSGTAPVTFVPTSNTAAVGTVSQVVTLNYIVPVGTGYRLVVTNGLVATNNLLGNSTAVIAYPLTSGAIKLIGNVSSLNGTISTSANTTNIFNNLTFDEICESVRIPVVATVVNTPAPTGNATQDACATKTIADFSVTGATGATFTWYDAAVAGNVIPTSTKVVLNTTYYVSQTVNGCEGVRLAIKASGPCLGVEDLTIAELRYYPNPVSDQLTITAKDAMTRVEVYNLLGQQLRVFDANSDNIQIDFNMYAPSTYLIKVYSENKVQFFKVIKR